MQSSNLLNWDHWIPFSILYHHSLAIFELVAVHKRGRLVRDTHLSIYQCIASTDYCSVNVAAVLMKP